jgi:FMN phosphatase YigB (HAD superfamily)
MGIECVFFDFDGTLTDAERHAPEFHQATRQEISLLLGVDLRTVELWWVEAEACLRSAPIETGWEEQGYIVASAQTDPYLFANMLTKRIVEMHASKKELAARNLAEIVFQIHKVSYERVRPPFQPLAKYVLEGAVERKKHVFVVTNSIGDSVSKQLDTLGLKCRDKVIVCGGAQKFVVASPLQTSKAFSDLPDSIWLDGLNRPVLLKRGRYFDVLQNIWAATQTVPFTTLVCGDIFELDLAMPSALGAHVHLVTRPTTLAYERCAALRARFGGAADNLAAILDRLDLVK